MSNSTIIFGRGEYAITEEKIPKLLAHLEKFQTTGVWIWALVDCLGIAKEGFKPRYNAILSFKSENEAFKVLQSKMESFVYPENITHPTQRGASVAAKEAKKVAKMELLSTLDLTEEQKAVLLS